MTTNYYWTAAEDDVVRGGHPLAELLDMLPNRTRDAILNRKSLLKQKDAEELSGIWRRMRGGATKASRPYTQADDAVLRARGNTPIAVLAEKLNRSQNSIEHRLKRLKARETEGSDEMRQACVRETGSAILQEWPDLPADAFKDIKLKPDTRLNFKGSYYG